MRKNGQRPTIVLILSDCPEGRAARKTSRPYCDICPLGLISPPAGKHIVQPTTDAELDDKPQPLKVNAGYKQIMDGSV